MFIVYKSYLKHEIFIFDTRKMVFGCTFLFFLCLYKFFSTRRSQAEVLTYGALSKSVLVCTLKRSFFDFFSRFLMRKGKLPIII